MKCPRCGKDSEKEWEYCPRCGLNMKRRPEFSGFSDIFQRVHKHMEDMNKRLDKDFEVFDLSPALNEMRERPVSRNTRGFRITMSSGTGKQPKISVKTFGDNDDEMRKEIFDQLGVEMENEIQKPEKEQKRRFRIPNIIGSRGDTREATNEEKELRFQGRTEEPKTEIRSMGSMVVVDMDIPGVRSEENIDVRELESSVEVKALAGDKAYFKILTKPSQFRLTEKRFEKGRLHLEFS